MNKYQKLVINVIEGVEKKNNDSKISSIPDGFESSVYDSVKVALEDARELCTYGEQRIALENLLSNLIEIGFPINTSILIQAKESLEKMNIDYKEWKYIEELLE